MSFKEADIKELASRDHEVLGSDFCSGYTDIFGKWNTGFECPRMGSGATVYCCGTITYKYCCTKRDQQSSSGLSQSVVVGSILGSVLVIVLVTLVSCLICRRCVPYSRRAHSSMNGGPLYTMHCSSTASGMANLYSFSGHTTAATTPLDTPHVLVDLDNPEHHIYAQPILNGIRGMGRILTRGETPTDPPPPYNEHHREESTSGADSLALQSSSSQQRPPPHNRRLSDSDVPQNRQYWQTKF